MGIKVVVCHRLRPNMWRRQNRTYLNVLVEPIDTGEPTQAAFEARLGPTHPWLDPASNEFIIEITDAEFEAMRVTLTNPLTWEGLINQPRWQQRVGTTWAVKEFGSWLDPRVATSTWRADVPIPEDRWRVRIYNGNPLVSGVHIAYEEIDESAAPGFVQRHLRLFNPDDTPSATGAQNQKTTIGGKRMIFDFTSGVSPFNVATDVVGDIEFPSNHEYKVVGPADERSVRWAIFGRTLRVEQ